MKSSDKQKFIISIRIKPVLEEDKSSLQSKDAESTIQVTSENSLTIHRKRSEEKIFKFNHVFLKQSQAAIYQRCIHLVNSVFDGHNSAFLAYGQTSTGKTYTVFGGKEAASKGFFHRSAEHVFSNIREKMHSRQFAIRVSFIQFYLDNIYDLIENNNKKLEIKQTPNEGVYIKDLTEVPVKSIQELYGCVKSAISNRKTERTSINERSSRSHAVIQIQVLQRWNDNGETLYQKGSLKIVDLAGSERVSKTESYGPRLQQAKRINKEITTLGKCINMLAQNEKQLLNNKSDVLSKFNFSKSHIPYRDSKITRFLADTLEGKSKIVLCVCVSQFKIHTEETFSSLMFAMQASTLKVESRRNEVYSVRKSFDKTNKSLSQTPVKVIKPEKNSISILQDEQKQSQQKQNQTALQRLLQEVDQIESYLSGQGVKTNQQSRQNLQINLIAFEKIFRIMRNKKQQEPPSKKSSTIDFDQ